MNTDHVFEHFIEPMRKRFTVPAGLPQDEFLAELAGSLSGFTVHQLTQAVEHFKRNHDQRTFPTEATCIRTCERFTAAPIARVGLQRFETEEDKRSKAIAERQARFRAARLCSCAMGRTAHAEGWLSALIEWVADRGGNRLPDAREIPAIKALAARNEASLEANRGNPEFAWLSRLRQSMHSRAHNEVFGWRETEAAE